MNSVRDFINSTVGQEVTEDTGLRVIVRDILNPVEMQYINTIYRMYMLVLRMHEETMNALAQNRRDIAADIVSRDADVRRMHRLVLRNSLLVVSNPALGRQLGIRGVEASIYYQLSKILLDAGRYEAELAEAVELLLASGADPAVSAKIRKIGDLVLALFRKAGESDYTVSSAAVVTAVIAEYHALQDEFRVFVNDIPRMPPQDIVAITTISNNLFELTRCSTQYAEIMMYIVIGDHVRIEDIWKSSVGTCMPDSQIP
jgi:phosphate uptake regulator